MKFCRLQISQKANQIGVLPLLHRAKICLKSSWLYERFEDTKIKFHSEINWPLANHNQFNYLSYGGNKKASVISNWLNKGTNSVDTSSTLLKDCLGYVKVEKILKSSLDSIPSPPFLWKFKFWAGKQTNFLKQKMFCYLK